MRVTSKPLPRMWYDSWVLGVIEDARAAGNRAALVQLAKLEQRGPKWSVIDSFTGRRIDTMLDVCGMAHLVVLERRGKFWQSVKRLSKNRANRLYTGEGGYLSIFDMTDRQEMSVNEAANAAAADVIRKKGGVDCYMESRID